jgi:large subunit ribosomal protein L23
MDILKKPVITEKQTKDTDILGTYGFIVDNNANKVEIRKAVEKMYGVNVTDVRTIVVPAKSKSRYTKAGILKGRRGTYKKAIVKLAEGETIDFFSEL